MKEKVCLRFTLCKNFKGSVQKQFTDALPATKYKSVDDSRVDDSRLFQSLYSIP